MSDHVTEKASSVTEKASSVTEKASSVTENASSVTEKASSVTEKASSVIEKANSVAETNSSVKEKAIEKICSMPRPSNYVPHQPSFISQPYSGLQNTCIEIPGNSDNVGVVENKSRFWCIYFIILFTSVPGFFLSGFIPSMLDYMNSKYLFFHFRLLFLPF